MVESDDFFLEDSFGGDPWQNIENRLQEQYMHLFQQSLDIVLTAWHRDLEIGKLKTDIVELAKHYKQIGEEYKTWFNNHKHSTDKDRDQNKAANVYTI